MKSKKYPSIAIGLPVALFVQLAIIVSLSSSKIALAISPGWFGIFVSSIPLLVLSIIIGYYISKYKYFPAWFKERKALLVTLLSILTYVLSVLIYINANWINR